MIEKAISYGHDCNCEVHTTAALLVMINISWRSNEGFINNEHWLIK